MKVGTEGLVLDLEVNIEETEHLRAFEDLLYDAVHLLYLAHDVDQAHDDDGFEFTYIRCSLLSTSLLFECGANCCIDSLNLPRALADDLDKIPFLSKYEMFLSRINDKAKFDRGCNEIQGAAELKSLRDNYVHPKVRKARYEQVDELVWNADHGATAQLKIPRNPREWRCRHAVLALQSANSFFNTFFLSWCGLDTDTVCEILLNSDAANIPAKSTTQIDSIGGLDRAVKFWGIDFQFIGKVISQ